MSYLDLIIKYLSGDLGQEERTSFEIELEKNADLKKTYEEHAAAFELIRTQLQEQDEKNFRAKLAESISDSYSSKTTGKTGLSRWWFIPAAIACTLAMLLVLFTARAGNEKIFSRYYHPEKDPVVLALNQDTRGEPEYGILQYRMGHYSEAMEILSEKISREKENKLILLYYILSALEADRQDEILNYLPEEDPAALDPLDQSLCWYSALAFIKSGEWDEAVKKLDVLSSYNGPYRNDAVRLEKVLLK